MSDQPLGPLPPMPALANDEQVNQRHIKDMRHLRLKVFRYGTRFHYKDCQVIRMQGANALDKTPCGYCMMEP